MRSLESIRAWLSGKKPSDHPILEAGEKETERSAPVLLSPAQPEATQEPRDEDAYRQALEQAADLAGIPIIESTPQEVEAAMVPVNVDDLQGSVKEEAIAIAKDILDKLRLQFADMTLDTLMSAGDLPMIDDLMSGVSEVADTFRHHLDNAVKLASDLMDDVLVADALEAIAIFNYHGSAKELEELELQVMLAEQSGDIALASELRAKAEKKRREVEAMPAILKQGGASTVTALLNKIEKGLDRVVSRMQDITQESGLQLGEPVMMPSMRQDAASGQEKRGDDQRRQTLDAATPEQSGKKGVSAQEAVTRKSEDKMKKFIRSDAAYDAIIASRKERQRKAAEARRQEQQRKQAARKQQGDSGTKQAQRQSVQTQQQQETAAEKSGGLSDLLSAASFNLPDINVDGLQENLDVMPNDPKRLAQSIIKGNQSKNTAIRSDQLSDRKAAERQQQQEQQEQNAAAQRKKPQMTR